MWRRVAEAALVPVLILLWSAMPGCSSTPDEGAAPEAAEAKKEAGLFEAVPEQGKGGNFGRETDPDQLFIQLDRQLRNVPRPQHQLGRGDQDAADSESLRGRQLRPGGSRDRG